MTQRMAKFTKAIKEKYGSQGTLKITYRLKDEHRKKVEIKQYIPVAKTKGQNKTELDRLKDEGNRLIREMSLAYAECFREVDGMVMFSYVLEDE